MSFPVSPSPPTFAACSCALMKNRLRPFIVTFSALYEVNNICQMNISSLDAAMLAAKLTSLFLLNLHGPDSPDHINHTIEKVDEWPKNPNGIVKEHILRIAIGVGKVHVPRRSYDVE